MVRAYVVLMITLIGIQVAMISLKLDTIIDTLNK
jgi:uncharacterized membrane protein YoaT (DUF817 family)